MPFIAFKWFKTAARALPSEKNTAHITPILSQLHWLPVVNRIQFKLLILVYKACHDPAPKHLAGLVQTYVPARTLRSSNDDLLVRSTVGGRAFRGYLIFVPALTHRPSNLSLKLI